MLAGLPVVATNVGSVADAVLDGETGLLVPSAGRPRGDRRCRPHVARGPVAAILQHNDLGGRNIVVGDSGFTAVDWEAARRFGLPLWDLLYFLTDALATLDRTTTPEEQDEHTRLLLRGDLRHSPLLFDWVRLMVATLEIPEPAVGPIAMLAWLHHGLSHVARKTAVQRLGSKPGLPAPAGRIAPIWLSDPLLGPGWKAWQGP